MQHVLVRPAKLTPREPRILTSLHDTDINACFPDGLTAVDFETTGTDLSDPAVQVFGIGWANGAGCYYIDTRSDSDLTRYVVHCLMTVPLTAFNVNFDANALYKLSGAYCYFRYCSFGLYKQLCAEGYLGQRWNLESAELELLGWPESNKADIDKLLKERKLSKSQMDLLPIEIVGKYCAMDAEAAYQLYQVFRPTLDAHPAVENYHCREFMTEVRLLIEQQRRGIQIDTQHLSDYTASVDTARVAAAAAFLAHPNVAPLVAEYSTLAYEAYKAAHPKGKLVHTDERFAFNINSKKQLAWLLYDRIGLTPALLTEGGQPAVSKKVTRFLGDYGKLLAEYNRLLKEEGYLAGLAEHLRDGVLHPQFKVPGTISLRLAGSGSVSCQQFPKTKGFLKSLVARPGHALVYADFSALEPRVLAELSRDPMLLKLYGRGRPDSDIYLHTAAHVEGFSKAVRRWFDPENPTPESIAAAKRECKAIRSLFKTVVLACQYGAGPKKIAETLTLGGTPTTKDEAYRLWCGYWQVYQGVRDWKDRLECEYRERGGWVLGVTGMPVPCAEEYLNDLPNRVIQGGGHQLLQRMIWYIATHCDRTQAHPYLIDTHDSTCWEVSQEYMGFMLDIYREAVVDLNEWLGASVYFPAEPKVGYELSELFL